MTQAISKPTNFFPIIRQMSYWTMPIVLRLPVTPNQITFLSLVLGLWGSWELAQGRYWASVWGGALVVLTILADSWDGELARAKDMKSSFGAHFDRVVDTVVNAVIFVGIGIGEARRLDEELWIWMGIVAGSGSVLNYAINLYLERRRGSPVDAIEPGEQVELRDIKDIVIYAFREVARSDFGFIVMAVAMVNGLFVMLALATIGAHVYWLTALNDEVRRMRC